MSEMSFSNSFRSPNKKDIGEIGITQLNETLTLLDNILDNYRKNYLFDDCLTFADVMFAPIAKQIEGWNIEINNPKIEKYIKRVLNHDSIRKYISDAKQFYDNISKSEVNSPKWIVSHYRYH
ncbi:TPA: glutathione S-transferase family protein, partial [Staphylococcus pseudintermedius]|nr:glutathione S-transferase family protein [Staphylococcus pseudintermedius]